MKLEDTASPLQDFGHWLFQYIQNLAGREGGRPVLQSSGWYRAPAEGKVCLYLYFIGSRGRSKHPSTVRLTTLWDKEFERTPWVEKGNNWFGSMSADFYARPDDPKAKERAERFIRQAFKVVATDIAVEAATNEEERREVREAIEVIVQGNPQASARAAWLKDFLQRAGKVTAVAVRDILVNVASDVVRKALLGQ
jgi:hypothetical protein